MTFWVARATQIDVRSREPGHAASLGRMSFDLIVVALPDGADEAQARVMAEQCLHGGTHADGELNESIVGFYEELRAAYPDHPPYEPDRPWAVSPLGTGIDHVVMNIRHGANNDVITVIEDLSAKYHLALYDPQGPDIYLPA